MSLLDALGLAEPEAATPEALLLERGQFFTPTWAAEALVGHYFPGLGPADYVVEPSCGLGAFLGAIPADVPAIGVEIDPALADRARAATGRPVITGDFREVEIPGRPTALIGNPPFKGALVAQMLDRAHDLLADGGRVGLILPAYLFQAPTAVLGWARRWSIAQDLIPRTLFPGLSMPLCFARFTRDRKPVLQGFFLYAEAREVEKLSKAYQAVLKQAPRSAWLRCVAEALRRLGGSATLDQLYLEIGGRRPSGTTWWREQVRKVAQQHLARVGPARYALVAEAA